MAERAWVAQQSSGVAVGRGANRGWGGERITEPASAGLLLSGPGFSRGWRDNHQFKFQPA